MLFSNPPITPFVVKLTLKKMIHWPAVATTRNRLPQAASNRPLVMIHHLKNTTVLSLLLTLAGGTTAVTQAAETPATTKATTPAKQPTQQTLTGKVTGVDKVANTISVQIKNQTYVLQLSKSTKIGKGAEAKNLQDVGIGEEISAEVQLRETPDGQVEVVVVSVALPTADTAEAQGKGGKPGKTGQNSGKGNDNGKGNSPFSSPPSWGSGGSGGGGGNNVSPHR